MVERRGSNIATKDEYLQFLKAAKLSDKQKLLLAAHARKRIMTAEELALAGGWTRYRSANVFYGKLGREIGEAIGLSPLSRSDGSPILTSMIAQEAPNRKKEAEFQWEMHDELASAIREIGLIEYGCPGSYSVDYELDQEYNRLEDIHLRFGGNRQRGISYSAHSPLIFLFTGKAGNKFGYDDGPQEDGTFLYTGEGKVGDMKFQGGNEEVRTHISNGKEILLFEALGHSKPVRFLGDFTLAAWRWGEGLDELKKKRRTIQFFLTHNSNAVERENDALEVSSDDFGALRLRAYDAAAASLELTDGRQVKSTYYERSRDIRRYALARAEGKCELTGEEAPFLTPSGLPFLEVHHMRRRADGGPDHPRWVAAITPNAHREIHHGANGADLNERLISIIGEKEGQ